MNYYCVCNVKSNTEIRSLLSSVEASAINLETLTKCAEWPQSAVRHVFGNLNLR